MKCKSQLTKASEKKLIKKLSDEDLLEMIRAKERGDQSVYNALEDAMLTKYGFKVK